MFIAVFFLYYFSETRFRVNRKIELRNGRSPRGRHARVPAALYVTLQAHVTGIRKKPRID